MAEECFHVFAKKALAAILILDHLKGHREAIDNVQRCLAEHPEIDIETFHKRFNALERKHRLLIAKITLNETTKKSN